MIKNKEDSSVGNKTYSCLKSKKKVQMYNDNFTYFSLHLKYLIRSKISQMELSFIKQYNNM